MCHHKRGFDLVQEFLFHTSPVLYCLRFAQSVSGHPVLKTFQHRLSSAPPLENCDQEKTCLLLHKNEQGMRNEMHMQNDAKGKWENPRNQTWQTYNIHKYHLRKTSIQDTFFALSRSAADPACILGGIRQCCRVCLLLEGNRVNCQPGIFQIKFMKCNQSGEDPTLNPGIVSLN